MRGYFGVGVERVSKSMNVGTIFRTAHAFGAGFVFTVDGQYRKNVGGKADTSRATNQVPFFEFPSLESLLLPDGCELVGVEITDDAIELPSFRHPQRAAYILGPERGALSPDVSDRCAFVVKIPTIFSVNVGIAAALVMYDRMVSLGRFPRRGIVPGGPVEMPPDPFFGSPRFRSKVDPYLATPPSAENPRRKKPE